MVPCVDGEDAGAQKCRERRSENSHVVEVSTGDCQMYPGIYRTLNSKDSPIKC